MRPFYKVNTKLKYLESQKTEIKFNLEILFYTVIEATKVRAP